MMAVCFTFQRWCWNCHRNEPRCDSCWCPIGFDDHHCPTSVERKCRRTNHVSTLARVTNANRTTNLTVAHQHVDTASHLHIQLRFRQCHSTSGRVKSRHVCSEERTCRHCPIAYWSCWQTLASWFRLSKVAWVRMPKPCMQRIAASWLPSGAFKARFVAPAPGAIVVTSPVVVTPPFSLLLLLFVVLARIQACVLPNICGLLKQIY